MSNSASMQAEKPKRKNTSSITQTEFVIEWILWQLVAGGLASITLLISLELLRLQIIREQIFFDAFKLHWVFPATILFVVTLAQFPILQKYISISWRHWFKSHVIAYLITLGCQFYLAFYGNIIDLFYASFSNFFIGFFVTVAPFIVLHSLIVYYSVPHDRRNRVLWYAIVNSLGLLLTGAYALNFRIWGYYCLIPVVILMIQGIIMWRILHAKATI